MDLRAYQYPANQYSHLSLKDLLDARTQYHVELMGHPNVVATAVGRYRIRKEDSWPTEQGMGAVHHKYKRTLENSEVRPYSWPAILVFVETWFDPHRFNGGAGNYDPDALVPSTLYLPDGRRVPVCVVEAPKDLHVAPTPPIRFPVNNIGGGFPVVVEVQGQEHVATIACLVSDGHTGYALTNRHVTGEEGEVVSAVLDGKVQRIGISDGKQFTQMPFEQLYPGWVGRDVFVNLDVGLIRIDNLDNWTAQIRDIGTMAPMADLSVNNISLQLIGGQVSGYGAASGHMEGEIHALFYRYKSQGGVEYVADLFIGPRTSRYAHADGTTTAPPPPFATHPGDSGTLWLLQPIPQIDPTLKKPLVHAPPGPPPAPLPLAMQWGQNTFDGASGAPQGFALATFLSRVCSLLEVDPIRDWNLDVPDTWGAVGHFSIAARTTVALSNSVPKLKKLMDANRPLITHTDASILKDDFKGMGSAKFVPLADIPDFFWKHGKQGHSRHFEGPNHFADMDQRSAAKKGTLLELCKKDPTFIDPDKWEAFYDTVKDLLDNTAIKPEHRGLLPFRVWQIFDAMVAYAGNNNKTAEFVCAAGVLTHYVGDACQPLHISYLHDGDPLRATKRTVHHRDGTVSDVSEALGIGVHSAYEDEMVNAHRKLILDGLKKTPSVKKQELVANGFEAAKLTVELMAATFKAVPPKDIVKVYLDYGKKPKAGRPAFMWKKFGPKTIDVMKDGTHLLGVLWESAWTKGKGEAAKHSMQALTQAKVMQVCGKSDFLPSLSVAEIGAKLKRN